MPSHTKSVCIHPVSFHHINPLLTSNGVQALDCPTVHHLCHVTQAITPPCSALQREKTQRPRVCAHPSITLTPSAAC